MAEIDSTAIGAGRKSIGNITYRYVNGRTIASKRVTKNKSQTENQAQQRFAFSVLASIGKSIKPITNIGFVRNSRGSQYANFLHYNKVFMQYARSSELLSLELPAISNLCIALNDPEFNGKLIAADGGLGLTTIFNWGVDNSIDAKLYLSSDFMEGDFIQMGVCYSYQLQGTYFEAVTLHKRELSEEDISDLAFKNQYLITEDTFPDIDLFGMLPPGYTDLGLAVIVIVLREKDRSTSYFQRMPDMP